MKAKDLMIGDMINGFGVVRRVTSINGLERPEDDGLLTTMVPCCEFPESNLSFRPCYAQPIPLTAEILEKNGFKKICEKFIWGEIDDELIEITPSINNSYRIKVSVADLMTICSIWCSYVHELQHALRLAGIEKEIVL